MLKSPYMYLDRDDKVLFFLFFFTWLTICLSLCRRPSKSYTNTLSLPHQLAGQQPSGRPEEEKPLSVSQWARRGPAAAHFPPAGLSFSSNPAAGRHQPYRHVRPHPLPPGLRPLQPSLLVHLPGQGHHGECQVYKPHSVILVYLHPPSDYCESVGYKGGAECLGQATLEDNTLLTSSPVTKGWLAQGKSRILVWKNTYTTSTPLVVLPMIRRKLPFWDFTFKLFSLAWQGSRSQKPVVQNSKQK